MRFSDLLGTGLASLRQRPFRTLLTVLGVVIAALYILLPYQRIFTGPARRVTAAPDLDGREKGVMGVLVAAMLVLGFLPGPVVEVLAPVAEPLALEQESSINADSATPAETVVVLAEGSGK